MKINSDEYITQKLEYSLPNEQLHLIQLTIMLGLKSIWYSKKWIIYVLFGIFPLFFAAISTDKLFGEENVANAFSSTFAGEFYLFIFVIGTLLIALIVSSDEISDHQIELYLVRPIKRENLWISRWIVVHIGIFLVNVLINTIYYLYYNLVDPEGMFSQFFDHLDLYVKSIYIAFILTMIYGGLYLLIGFMGSRGFTLGVLIAVIESFFLSLLFLKDSVAIPKTHYLKILDQILGSFFTYDDAPSGLTFLESYVYIFIFSAIFFLLGYVYIRRKEFN